MQPWYCVLIAVVGLARAGTAFAGTSDEAGELAPFCAASGELSEAQSKRFFDMLAKSHFARTE